MAPGAGRSMALARLLLAFQVAVGVTVSWGQVVPGCITNFNNATDYFSQMAAANSGEPFALPIATGLSTTVTNAFNFSVQYGPSYKVVRDSHENRFYVLYQCGSPKPLGLPVPAASTFYFQIPVQGYVVDSDVPVPFLQLLGQLGGLRWANSFVVDPCAQAYQQAARLPLPPGGDANSFPGTILAASSDPKFSPLTPHSISFSATQDPGPLNRAEWIKYMALFFNLEERAASVFKAISEAYQCLNGSAPASEPKPVAAWVSFYDGSWTLSAAQYKLQYVADAGGANAPEVLALGPGSTRAYNMSKAADVSAFKALLASVDVVFDETFLPLGPPSYSLSNFTRNAALSDAEAQSLKIVASPNIWSIYGTYSTHNDSVNGFGYSTAWFEGAVAQPQLVLQEMLGIFHPSLFPLGFPRTFLYNVAQGELAKLVTASNCTAVPTAAVDPTPVSCPRSPISAPPPPSSGRKGTAPSLALTAITLLLLPPLLVVNSQLLGLRG